ncbi:unnamed protein product [Penicillium pancosmium]
MSGSLNFRGLLPENSLAPLDKSQCRPVSRDGFEIAIICALPRETNAVLCAMDEIWHDCRHYYGRVTGDDNSYDFGRMGSHCVVIVTLPRMGPVAASSASRSLRMSFNSIQLALLVGICGAVPFKKDDSEILLGDVIISDAIVELDYGRQYQGGFQRKDSLLDVHGRPNGEILGLLQRWKIPTILETLRRGSIWHLRHLLQRLQIDYPGASNDMLFASDFMHKHRTNCLECSGTVATICESALAASCSDNMCDEAHLVTRHRLEAIKWGSITPDPNIHIGSIGTGNAVVKSAWHRDHHAQSEGIIAFEMEGVGVWDTFNCLVIKGVCDYADSHKSKVWQDYAATVAVAVAKEVLGQYVRPEKLPQPTIPIEFLPQPRRDLFAHSRQKALRTIQDPGFLCEKESHQILAQQRILASLRFPQMQERAQQIATAHDQTYEWALEAPNENLHRWDGIVRWLSSSAKTKGIYWISGKPGSGKSTLMRYLEQKLDLREHMLPWAQGCSVIRASYFSWNSGNMLQKSLEGLWRSLLSQILTQRPDLIPEVIDDTRLGAAQENFIGSSGLDNLELISSLKTCILALQKLSIKILFFVDGLDEFECTDEAREDMIETFRKFAYTGNIKVFLSGRPWNIFQDTLDDIPKIRLEDLTRDDIKLYVRGSFLGSPRFRHLLSCDPESAEALTFAVVEKAEGVFLWVRLVVRDLLKGVRDGDSIDTVQRKLNETPPDLNEYFKRLFFSIGPEHMQEASTILQIALHEEDHFVSLHPLRLLDLSFIEEPNLEFAEASSFNHRKSFNNDLEGLRFRLDSTIRRLNSRCMGLLECIYNPESFVDLFCEEFSTEKLEDTLLYQGQKFDRSIYSEVFDGPNLLRAFMPTVDFLHRCCRDFLLSPDIQCLLHQHTAGEYDARMLIVNARISQFLALQKAGCGRSIASGLASYILSALSIPEWKENANSIRAACILKPAIEAFLCHGYETYSTGWYIGPVLTSWREEKSNFLTLAIDFDLRGYCMEYLIENEVQSKKGRPILDYILRPRFASGVFFKVGNSVPKVDLLYRALTSGADPNGLYHGVSVWALFLSSTADWLHRGFHTSASNKSSYLRALRMMMNRGAAPFIPCSWVSNDGLVFIHRFGCFQNAIEKHYRRPEDLPIVHHATNWQLQPSYAVADLLATFRIQFGPDIDDLIQLARAIIDGDEN